MGERWESAKADLGSGCFQLAAVGGWSGGILLFTAIVALPVRFAYFLKVGSWPLSVCDGQQFFLQEPVCSIDTDWHGFDQIVSYVLSSMDMSLAAVVAGILLLIASLAVANLGSAFERSGWRSRERRLAKEAAKEEHRRLAQASR